MGDVPPEDEDRGAGAEIGGDRQQAAGILGPEGVARLHIGADIGASEAIDHLLRVADQEERARPDAEGLVVSAHGSSSDCNPALFSVSFSAIHKRSEVDHARRSRRVLVQLNRGEGRHQLARIVFHGKAANCGSAIGKARRTNSAPSAWW